MELSAGVVAGLSASPAKEFHILTDCRHAIAAPGNVRRGRIHLFSGRSHVNQCQQNDGIIREARPVVIYRTVWRVARVIKKKGD